MEDIRLKSSYDGHTIPITPAVARLSKVIKDKLEAHAQGFNIYPANKKEIPIIIDTRGENLEKIIEWCEHHKDDTEEEYENVLKHRWTPKENIPPWDKEFFEVNARATIEFLLASMQLKLEVMCIYAGRAYRNLSASKTPREVQQILNINHHWATYIPQAA